MESCKEAGRDALDARDASHEPTFTEFAALFAELYAWLSGIQEAAYSEETSAAERVAHLERLHREAGRRAQLNEHADRVLLRYPELRDEVSWRVAHINSKWDGLLLAMAPAQAAADHNAGMCALCPDGLIESRAGTPHGRAASLLYPFLSLSKKRRSFLFIFIFL